MELSVAGTCGHNSEHIFTLLFYLIQDSELSDLRESIETTNQQREITQFIEDYAVLEQLGSGAFGSVCKVKKKDSGQSFYALKEVTQSYLNFSHNNEMIIQIIR